MPTYHPGPVLYCGDPHGAFRHIIEAAAQTRASAVVLLGDLEPGRALHEELAPLMELGTALYFIPGNHDADSDVLAERVWGSELASRNVHGRVVTLPDGRRLAGLGGIFRGAVWNPANLSEPAFRTREEHARVTPRQHRWKGGPPRKHLATIYPEDIDRLAELQADILVTHEAPGHHRHGFATLDTLARAMGVKVTVHGHQHDRLNSSAIWDAQGFKSFGVGLRGITEIDSEGHEKVIVPGDLDERSGGGPLNEWKGPTA
jgi:predicted phosphodiesterase